MKLNLNRSIRSGFLVRICLIVAAFGWFAGLAPGSERSTQAKQADVELEITKARELAKTTQQTYLKLKQLSESGSTSQREVRRAELAQNLALLDLSTLVEPSRRERNDYLKARLILRYRTQELDLIRELYRRGSISRTNYRRAVANRDIAKSNFEAVKSATETQRKLREIEMAKSRLELIQQEYDVGRTLLQSGSISQTRMDELTSQLKIATAELESRKKALGARAIEVKR